MVFFFGRTNARSEGRAERGGAPVELALVAPLLVVLAFGIWSVARGLQVKSALDQAVLDGVQTAAAIEPWDDQEALAVIEAALTERAIPAASFTVGCLELVHEHTSGCVVDGVATVNDARVTQVAVTVFFDDHPIELSFFTIPVDLRAQAAARHGS